MERKRFSIKFIPVFAVVFVAGAAAAALLIYFTPLRYLAIVEPKVRDIKPADFYSQFKKDPGKFVFIDVRPSDVYLREHAEGAINIPLHQLYFERAFLPRHKQTIVLICSGGAASGVAYSYLEHYGFFNLYRVAGGIEAWKAARLPVAGTNVFNKSSFAGSKLALETKPACPG